MNATGIAHPPLGSPGDRSWVGGPGGGRRGWVLAGCQVTIRMASPGRSAAHLLPAVSRVCGRGGFVTHHRGGPRSRGGASRRRFFVVTDDHHHRVLCGGVGGGDGGSGGGGLDGGWLQWS